MPKNTIAPPITDDPNAPDPNQVSPMTDAQPITPTEPDTQPSSILGSEIPPGQPIPQNKMHEAGKAEFHDTMRSYDKADAANSAAMLAADPSSPDYHKKLADAMLTQGNIKAEKAHFQQMHPWGSPESAHPGVLGKIGHVAGEVGQVIGNEVLGPGAMSAIPGTQANLGAQATAGRKEGEAAIGDEQKEAQTGLQTAQAGEAEAREESLRNPQSKITNDFELWRQQNPTSPVADWFKLQNSFKQDKPDTATQNKQAFQNVIGKMDGAGIKVNPTDYNKVRQALDEAQQKGLISPEEHSTAMGYLAANPTPGMNATVNVNEKGAAEGIKEGAEFYAVNGKFMRGRDMTPEQRAEAVPVKDVEKAEHSIRSTNAAISTFQRYKNTVDRANLSPTDIQALQVLTAPQTVAHSYLEKETSGVLDTIFGEPLTGFSEKAMGGIMTKDQYDKLSPDAQKALVGYYNSLIANFADMKERLGGIGRNESMIQAEIHTIPLPYIGRGPADEAFNQKLNDIAGRNIYMHGLNQPNTSQQENQNPGGEELKPPKPADNGMKWQHKTGADGQVQWRQVPSSNQ